MKKLLTIAGSDSSGGAGIQADLKTFAAHLTYGMSVITALTAQNTCGVREIQNASLSIIENQIDAVFEDIMPDSVKVGMLSNSETIKLVSKKLIQYKVEKLVIDPVLVSTSGHKLSENKNVEFYKKHLFRIATVVTPNIPEAEVIANKKISNLQDMREVAELLSKEFNTSFLVKGGHLETEATDILYYEGKLYEFNHERIDNKNTHGTGCSLSSAIAANLALGYSLVEATEKAIHYVHGAIASNLDLGKGNGPLNHMYQFMGDSKI